MQAVKAFESFREKAVHQALVMDEFGGVLGLVTLYDVLESIVGAIPLNEFDLNQEVVLRPMARGLLMLFAHRRSKRFTKG